MKTKLTLLLLLAVSALATPTQEYALALPRSMILQRLDTANSFAFMFDYAGDPDGAMYFKGRADVYRELLMLLDDGTPKEEASK